MNLTGWLLASQPRTRRVGTLQYSRSGQKRVVSSSALIYSPYFSIMLSHMFAPVNSTNILAHESGRRGVQISSIKGLRVSPGSGFLRRIDCFLGNAARRSSKTSRLSF